MVAVEDNKDEGKASATSDEFFLKPDIFFLTIPQVRQSVHFLDTSYFYLFDFVLGALGLILSFML